MDAENIEMASMGNGEEDAKQPLLSRRRAKLKKVEKLVVMLS